MTAWLLQSRTARLYSSDTDFGFLGVHALGQNVVQRADT